MEEGEERKEREQCWREREMRWSLGLKTVQSHQNHLRLVVVCQFGCLVVREGRGVGGH